MVGTMFAAMYGVGHEDGGSPPGVGRGWVTEGAMIMQGSSEAVTMEASSCTLWSTIALGALIQGRPTDSVGMQSLYLVWCRLVYLSIVTELEDIRHSRRDGNWSACVA